MDGHRSHYCTRGRIALGAVAILLGLGILRILPQLSPPSILAQLLRGAAGGGQPERSLRCAGIDLVRPAVAVSSRTGTYEPRPLLTLDRRPKLRPYLGLPGRPPAVPTWIVTNGSVSSTLRFYDTSPFRLVGGRRDSLSHLEAPFLRFSMARVGPCSPYLPHLPTHHHPTQLTLTARPPSPRGVFCRSPSGRMLAFLRFPDGAEGKPVKVGAGKGSPPLPYAEVRRRDGPPPHAGT
jgi:hypothetical protein